MPNTIKIKRKTTTGAPSAVSLDVGEMCWNDADSQMYIKDGSGTVNKIGGGLKEYAEFYQGSGGITAISNTAKQFNISSTRINSNVSVFSIASNEITINKDGHFKFSFDVYLNNSSSSRTEYSFYIQRDSGGGYSEVSGTRSASYQRGYDSGMSSSINCILDVSSGDKFRIMVIRTDGSSSAGYQDNNGTRLTIEEK